MGFLNSDSFLNLAFRALISRPRKLYMFNLISVFFEKHSCVIMLVSTILLQRHHAAQHLVDLQYQNVLVLKLCDRLILYLGKKKKNFPDFFIWNIIHSNVTAITLC